MLKLILATAALLATVSVADAQRRTIRVIDGDTIKASNLRASVRISGYDSPEIQKNIRSGYRCEQELEHGLRAKAELERLLTPPNVVVVKRTLAFDEYGRRLARVTVNGHDLADLMIGQGMAKPWGPGMTRPKWCE